MMAFDGKKTLFIDENRKFSKEKSVRTCVSCGRKAKKGELLRIVRRPQGDCIVDLTGKSDGRGVYVCKDAVCINKLIKKRLLGRALKVGADNAVYEALKEAFVDRQEQN